MSNITDRRETRWRYELKLVGGEIVQVIADYHEVSSAGFFDFFTKEPATRKRERTHHSGVWPFQRREKVIIEEPSEDHFWVTSVRTSLVQQITPHVADSSQ